MTCDVHAEDLARVVADDAPLTAALKRHVASCPQCRAVLAWHQQLDWCGFDDDAVSEAEWTEMRQSVLRRIAPTQAKPMRRWSQWSLAALAAVACMVLGSMLGYLAGVRSAGIDGLIEDLRTQWHRGPGKAPYALKNIDVRPAGQGRVMVGFDVSTWVESVMPQGDPLVKDLLVASLRQSDSLNQRLQALELTGASIDDEVQAALLDAMRHDEALVVRSRAMDLLAPYAARPEVSAALREVLRTEPNVQLRLQAIDALMAQSSAADRLDALVDDLLRAQDTPVLIRVDDAVTDSRVSTSHPEH